MPEHSPVHLQSTLKILKRSPVLTSHAVNYPSIVVGNRVLTIVFYGLIVMSNCLVIVALGAICESCMYMIKMIRRSDATEYRAGEAEAPPCASSVVEPGYAIGRISIYRPPIILDRFLMLPLFRVQAPSVVKEPRGFGAQGDCLTTVLECPNIVA